MFRSSRSWRARAGGLSIVVALAAALLAPVTAGADDEGPGTDRLVARAVLPAETFAPGPTSGRYVGEGPINGVDVPFGDAQPVQGFSAVRDNEDGTFWAMSDNGFGAIENSADYLLRLYRIRPHFEAQGSARLRARYERGDGGIDVVDHLDLRDPDGHIPFAIVNHFTDDRLLTGADFDIESFQVTRDGDIWIGDEFGPFVLHFDDDGVLQEPPIALPDPRGDGELRAPQNPYNEESSTLRVMNAVRAHAIANGAEVPPVVSPWHVMLADGLDTTFVDNRENPPADLAPASSEIHDVASLQRAGFPVVPYTINDAPRMVELLDVGVDGIISDRPDVLYDTISGYDADGDGTAGDYLLPDGRIDSEAIDAQGHRGGRDLRPENTLPAMEVALDNLMTTLETDTAVTADGVAVLGHDPAIESGKCRRADGSDYGEDDEVFVRDLTAAEVQERFVCDGLIRGPEQTNDLDLSPVSVAFAAETGLADPYVMPTPDQLFDFVDFYVEYYRSGDGASDPRAEVLATNAERVRFNVETKLNPRAEFSDRTLDPQAFVDATAGRIVARGLADRADVQSFDWRSLLLVHEQYPSVRTVFLFGDFPVTGGAGDGTNLQDEDGANTPWLAGLFWPYRVTALDSPLEVPGSGGFEGMALAPDGETLYPLLEKPLPGEEMLLRLFELDTTTSAYTGDHWFYPLDPQGQAIGDFVLFDDDQGLVIERDNSQGDLDGYKAVHEIMLPEESGDLVVKAQVLDLLHVADPRGISTAGDASPGDVGLGDPFAFPFVTIESVTVMDHRTIAILNDNNFPFSVGRHVGTGAPDDNEMVVIRLGESLGEASRRAASGPSSIDLDPGSAEPLDFALLGDLPYGDEQRVDFPALIDDVNADPDVEMVVHVGDIKAGGTECSDARFWATRVRFDQFEDPFVLTPGDNEWTDCHRETAGEYVPVERLERLREIFFPNRWRSLGETRLRLRSQGGFGPHAPYVENRLWQAHQVVFSTVHVVGSNNDLAPWDQLPDGDRPEERLAEYEDRMDAALQHIRFTFAEAERLDAPGVFVALHANMIEADPDDGFQPFERVLVRLAARYGKPVMVAHGDFHYLIVDTPYDDAPNLTRVQTFGAEVAHWLEVTVDPTSPEVFSLEEHEVSGLVAPAA